MVITSTSNIKVKRLVTLRKKSKAREEEGVFLTEGIRMFREVPGKQLKELYVSESFYKKQKELITEISNRSAVRAEVLSDTVYSYVSDTKTPQGVLCVVKQKICLPMEVWSKEGQHILVLDNLQDPGNLGTIIRTAEGAGVTGIIMSSDCVDVYNPKTIRSTMGSVYRMPFAYADNLTEVIKDMKDKGIHVFAAHLDGEKNYDEEDYHLPCAFLIGNEGNGLREEVADCANYFIKIPMQGQVESLNAAIAASVLMFEVSRQRRGTSC